MINNVVTQMYSTGKQTNTQDWVHLTLFSNNLEEIQQNQDDIIPKMSPNIGKNDLADCIKSSAMFITVSVQQKSYINHIFFTSLTGVIDASVYFLKCSSKA